jgi:hypothetical protein
MDIVTFLLLRSRSVVGAGALRSDPDAGADGPGSLGSSFLLALQAVARSSE